VTHEDLTELFSKFGEIEEIEIPFRRGGKGQLAGIAFVRYKTVEATIAAFAALDKQYF